MQNCYYPNKSIAPVDAPCNSSAPVSPCCRSDSFCLDNGLCLLENTIVTGSCTEENWDIACPTYCYEATNAAPETIIPCGVDADDNIVVSCYKDHTCSLNFTLQSDGGLMMRKEQAQSLGFGSSVVVRASTVFDLPGPENGTCNSSDSAGTSSNLTSDAFTSAGRAYAGKDMAAVGAGIGIPLGLVIACLGILLHRERAKGQKVLIADNQPCVSPIPLSSPVPDHDNKPAIPQELEATRNRQELSTEHS